ncbi:MAG: hypothetical protein HC769_08965 [Cyanobacteria bacterium CRU_2_1]|nr:hypothetical protein [Cyanobacteria bacterium CRU_2_1]
MGRWGKPRQAVLDVHPSTHPSIHPSTPQLKVDNLLVNWIQTNPEMST